jgi:hypothetical protein
VLLVSDFEAQSVYAALLARLFTPLPIIGIDNMAMFRFAEPLGLGSEHAPRLRRLRPRVHHPPPEVGLAGVPEHHGEVVQNRRPRPLREGEGSERPQRLLTRLGSQRKLPS